MTKRFIRPIQDQDLILSLIEQEEVKITESRKRIKEMTVGMVAKNAEKWRKEVIKLTNEKFGRITSHEDLTTASKRIFHYDPRTIKTPTGPNRAELIIAGVQTGVFDEKPTK